MAYSKNRRLAEIVSDTAGNLSVEGIIVPTQSSSDNDTSAASTAFVHAHIDAVLDSAPGTLNTLNEIAAALNDDANFNTTVTNAIAAKLPLAGGTLTGALVTGDLITANTARIIIQRSNDDSSIVFANNASGTPSSHTWAAGLNYSNSNAFTIAYNSNGLASLEQHKMVISTSGNVGIGTDSPDHTLHVLSGSASMAEFASSNASPFINFARSGARTAYIQLHEPGATGTSQLRFGTGSSHNPTTSMTIDENNNVGIGVTNPGSYDSRAERLVVGETGDAGITIAGGANSDCRLVFAVTNQTDLSNGSITYDQSADSMAFETGGTNRVTIDSGGHTSFTLGTNAMGTFNDAIGEVGTGTFALQVSNSAGSALKPLGFRAEDIRFATGSAERMRIDSSGDLNIVNTGQASLNYTTDGSADYARITGGKSGSGVGDLRFFTYSGGIAERMQINSAGSVFVEQGKSIGWRYQVSGTHRGSISCDSGDNITFANGSGASERMRISNDGNISFGAGDPDGFHPNAHNFVMGTGSGDQGMTVFSGTNVGRYAFARATGITTDTYDGGMSYDGSRNLKFHTNANATRMTIDGQGNVGIGDDSPGHKLEVKSTENYKAIHIKGTNAPCYTMARGDSTAAEWRMGLSGYDYSDFAISSGTGTNDRFRIDPDGNMILGSANNVTPRAMHDISLPLFQLVVQLHQGIQWEIVQQALRNARDWFVYSRATKWSK